MDNFIVIPKEKMNELPKKAGIYSFLENGKTIYIGKAINIRDRVKNHFNQPSYRDNLFIDKVDEFGFYETGSEIEALVLEANLIKKHQPKFNVVWRDDKNYFYVAITKPKNSIDARHPYVFITHQKNDPRAKYIGPFVEGNALKKTLKYLRRVFPFYTIAKHPKIQCTWCHLGLCPGPNPNIAEYKKNLKKLILILQGKRKNAVYALRKEMQQFSHSREYENAIKIRDKINALQRVMQHTHVIENSKLEIRNSKLSAILGMSQEISKIECYDISNIQGKQAVGSMVVFVDGIPDKSQYKKFRIRMKQEPNDIAMLKEVLERRFNHPEWEYPEIILIDGGIAQLNVALKAVSYKLEARNIKVISIAKGRQELFIEGRKKPIPLKALPQDIYNLIVHLDDEAHRFAIAYHKKLRKKAMLA